MEELQTKIVTVDELMQMKPPNPRIEIGFDKLQNLRGTWIELAEHTEGKLCPICKIPVEQKLHSPHGTGQYWEVPNGSVCPRCGVVFEHDRWVFSRLTGDYAYLYQFNPQLDMFAWNNYFICPIKKDVYICIIRIGKGSWTWRGSVFNADVGHHDWTVGKEAMAIPMTLEMVGCDGEELVKSIYLRAMK